MSNFIQPYAILRHVVSEYVGICRNILNFYSGLESMKSKKALFPASSRIIPHPPAFYPLGDGGANGEFYTAL